MRVAVVGFGHLGNYHAQKVQGHSKAKLVGIVDPAEDRQSFARSQGYEVITDWKSENLDAIIIASPTHSHAKLCEDALNTGLHVLVEKPFTTTSEEARPLIELAERASLVLQVGQVERFNPAFQAVSGKLEQVKYITGERLSPFSGRSTDIDVIADLMIHDLDIIASLVTSPVAEVRAIGMPIITNEIDMASARIEFQNGTVAEISAGRASLEPSRKIRFITPERYISIDYGTKDIKVVKRDINSEVASITMEPASTEVYDQLEKQFDAFYRSVTLNEPVMVDGNAGLNALILAEEVQSAIARHLSRIDLPEGALNPSLISS